MSLLSYWLLIFKPEGRIEWRQWCTKEQAALHSRHEGRVQHERQHLGQKPVEHRVLTGLRQEDALGAELEAMEGTYITLSELLHSA